MVCAYLDRKPDSGAVDWFGHPQSSSSKGRVHFFASLDERGIREKRRLVVYKRFILLLGVFLSSHVPAAGQTTAPQIVLAHEHVAPALAILPTLSTPFPATSFLLSRDAGKSNNHVRLLFEGAYERDYTLEHLSPMDEVKTLTLTQRSLPLVRLWGGRLQLEAFHSTPHIHNDQLGPFGGGMPGFRLPGQRYPSGPRPLNLSGLSLSLHFSRDARTGHPAELWHRLTRMVDAVLN